MRQATRKLEQKARMQDQFKLRGYLEFVLRDARSGRIVSRGKKQNTVTAWGRGWALARLTPASDAQVLSAIAIGSSSTGPTSNDTKLVGFATIVNIGTTGLTSATNSACTYTAAVSFASNQTFTGSNQIGEFALYNSSSTTNAAAAMFNRLNTTAFINFATSNTLSITITITN